jgi:sphinganine C4-monooxygenase
MAAANLTSALPPLPEYTLRPLPPLVPWLEDKYTTLVLPIVTYWVVSGIYHLMDTYDLFPQYRLHTPAEVLKRNHVTRWEVLRDVITQQIIQTFFGFFLAYIDEEAMTGKDDYEIARWAQRIRLAQRAIPAIARTVGLDAVRLAGKLSGSYPTLAGAISGGLYPWSVQLITAGDHQTLVPAFAPWELQLGRLIYYVGTQIVQYAVAMVILDTWQYFLHRAMHQNKWLYTTFHVRHHRLYVPYAYGALYNHPFEGFLLDTLGAGFAYIVVGMTCRQSMWFFTCSTIKTIDDHCGYSIPWDPLQLITSNNAGYHDIHHQSWGIKNNFSQPFFTWWDHYCGTVWKGGDVSERYEKSRRLAQLKVDQDNGIVATKVVADNAVTPSSSDQEGPVRSQPLSTRRTTRKKSSSISHPSDSLKGLRNKVGDSLHGKARNVLGVESRH